MRKQAFKTGRRAALFLLFTILVSSLFSADWPAYKGNQERTGYNPDGESTAVYTLQQYSGPTETYQGFPDISTPLLSGNYVYIIFGSNIHKYPIDETGETIGIPEIYNAEKPIIAHPLIENGILYAGTISGDLLAVNTANMTEVWRVNSVGAVFSSPLYISDSAGDRVIFLNNTGKIFVLNAVTGDIIITEEIKARGYITNSPALGDKIIITADSGEVFSMDTITLTPSFNGLLDEEVHSSAVFLSAGRYVTADYSGKTYLFDTASGFMGTAVMDGNILSPPVFDYNLNKLYLTTRNKIDNTGILGVFNAELTPVTDPILKPLEFTAGGITNESTLFSISQFGKLKSYDRQSGDIHTASGVNNDPDTSLAMDSIHVAARLINNNVAVYRKHIATATPTATMTSTATITQTHTITMTPTITPFPPQDTIYVNCGGGEYVTSEKIWQADQAYTPGSWGYDDNGGRVVSSTTHPIENTEDDILYQQYSYFKNDFPNQIYRFDVYNGEYRVILKFVEPFFDSSLNRVFNVRINNNDVLTFFNIYAEAGKNSALDKTFIINVTNKQIAIEFIAIEFMSSFLDNPIISAIAIERVEPFFPTETITRTVTETITETVTETTTPSVTETVTETTTETATKTITKTATITKTVTETATETVTQTVTETATETVTKTITATATQTVTKTATETVTQTVTETATPTVTETVTDTITKTLTTTATETVTETTTETITQTVTETVTLTNTPEDTLTNTPSVTESMTETATQTVTPTFTETPLPTATIDIKISWNQYGNNPGHTFRSSYLCNIRSDSPVELAYNFYSPHAVKSLITDENNNIYFHTGDEINSYIIKINTLGEAEYVQLEEGSKSGIAIGAYEHLYYYAHRDGFYGLEAMNLETGIVDWNYGGTFITSYIQIAGDDSIYFGSRDRGLTKLTENGFSPQLMWDEKGSNQCYTRAGSNAALDSQRNSYFSEPVSVNYGPPCNETGIKIVKYDAGGVFLGEIVLDGTNKNYPMWATKLIVDDIGGFVYVQTLDSLTNEVIYYVIQQDITQPVYDFFGTGIMYYDAEDRFPVGALFHTSSDKNELLFVAEESGLAGSNRILLKYNPGNKTFSYGTNHLDYLENNFGEGGSGIAENYFSDLITDPGQNIYIGTQSYLYIYSSGIGRVDFALPGKKEDLIIGDNGRLYVNMDAEVLAFGHHGEPLPTPVGTVQPVTAWSVIDGSDSATIIWDPAEGNVLGYNVYQSGSPYSRLNDEWITETSYKVTGLEPNREYSFIVTSIDEYERESSPSEVITFIFGTPTITITATPTITLTPTPTIETGKLNLQVANVQADNDCISNQTTSKEFHFDFKITNNDTIPININTLKVKMWFYDENNIEINGFFGGEIRDSSGNWKTNVSGTLSADNTQPYPVCETSPDRKANRTAVLSFNTDYEIPAGGHAGSLDGKLHINNYQDPFDPGCDNYSKLLYSTEYSENRYFVLYENDTLVKEWLDFDTRDSDTGIEPCEWPALPTGTITITETAGPAATQTFTPTVTPTSTESITQTVTETITETVTQTATSTITGTASQTFTPSSTETFTESATQTITQTATETVTMTITTTTTQTATPNITISLTSTQTVTYTPTFTQTPTPDLAVIDIILEHANENITLNTQEPMPKFKLTNNDSGVLALSSVEIRYYYQMEGTAQENTNLSWASVGGVNLDIIAGNFGGDQDRYLRVTFEESAGSLNTNETAEIKARFNKTDWSEYNQGNDYSFRNSGEYAQWYVVTVYIDGTLVWGTGPGIQPLKITNLKTPVPSDSEKYEPISAKNTYNYPNPCFSETTIRFSLHERTKTNIIIFTTAGTPVWEKILPETDTRQGINKISWNLANMAGRPISNGIYILKIITNDRTITKKIAVVR